MLLPSFSMPLFGPLARNNAPETLSAIARIPALAAQHLFRISLAWHFDRTNPALIVLGAAWAGLALALLFRLV